MSDEAVGHCWNCGAAFAGVLLPLSRHEFCRACGEALHCCRQCQWFAPGSAGECREARAEPPSDKTSANFCEWFAPAARGPAGAGQPPRSAADEARAKLEALFGPKDPAD
jgi:hypothetical protein